MWRNFCEDPGVQKHFLYCQQLWIRKTFIWKWDFVCHTFWSTYHQSRLSFYDFCRYFYCNRYLKDQRGYERFYGEHWTHPLALAMWKQVAGFYQRTVITFISKSSFSSLTFLGNKIMRTSTVHFHPIPMNYMSGWNYTLRWRQLLQALALSIMIQPLPSGSYVFSRTPQYSHFLWQLWVKQICTQMLTLL